MKNSDISKKSKILILQGSWKKLFSCFIKKVAKIQNNFEKKSANPYLFSQINSLIHNIFVMSKEVPELIDEAIDKWHVGHPDDQLGLYIARFKPMKPSDEPNDFLRGSVQIVFRVLRQNQPQTFLITRYQNQQIVSQEKSQNKWVGYKLIHDYQYRDLQLTFSLLYAKDQYPHFYQQARLQLPTTSNRLTPVMEYLIQDDDWVIVTDDGFDLKIQFPPKYTKFLKSNLKQE